MASVEDSNLAGSQKAGKEKVHETTHIVAGELRLPESGFERQRTHKVANHNKPAKCGGNGCRYEAVMRVDVHGAGPKNFCPVHWHKIKGDTSKYDESSKMMIDPEMGEDIRGEDRVVRQQTRAEAAVELFKSTGTHHPVRGPGNPRDAVDPDADHITPVIGSAVAHGGRSQPAISEVDHKSLMHKLKVGGAPKTQDQQLSEIAEDMSRNSRTETPNSFDDVSDLMNNDSAPSRREAGLRSGDRPDD
jgi:hypothetical protein